MCLVKDVVKDGNYVKATNLLYTKFIEWFIFEKESLQQISAGSFTHTTRREVTLLKMCPSQKIDIQNSLRQISNFLKRGFHSHSREVLYHLIKMATSITWKHLHYLVVANFSLIYFLIEEEKERRVK